MTGDELIKQARLAVVTLNAVAETLEHFGQSNQAGECRSLADGLDAAIEADQAPPTCVVCGDPIREEDDEVPCWIEPSDRENYGDYDGEAYHLNICEGGIFDTVYSEVE